MRLALDSEDRDLTGERLLWAKVIKQAVIDEDYAWLKSSECNYLLHVLGTDWESALNSIDRKFRDTIVNEIHSPNIKYLLWNKYLESNSLSKVAKETKLSYSYVHKIIGGLVSAYKNKSKEELFDISNIDKMALKSKILEETKAGLSIELISNKYSVPKSIVKNWVISDTKAKLKLEKKETLCNKLWEEYLECKDPVKVAENNGISRSKFYTLVKGKIKR